MSYTLETISCKNPRWRIRIEPDDTAECPLEWDHPYYPPSGARTRRQPNNSPNRPAVYMVCMESDSTLYQHHEFDGHLEALGWARRNGYAVFDLHYEDYGSHGATLRVGAHDPAPFARHDSEDWEVPSNHDGFVLVERSEFSPVVRRFGRTYMTKRDPATGRFVPVLPRLLKAAESLADTVETWANGGFVGFIIERLPEEIDPDEANDRDWEHEDSCWGFEGTEVAIEAAKENLPEEANHDGA